MKMEFWIRKALRTDLGPVGDLLAACGLPTSGVEQHLAESYAVALATAAASDHVIGVAGVEVYGGRGLLRSVAVLPAWQGRAVSRSLVRDRLAWAKQAGLDGIYLLAIDAAGYFGRLGFARVDREEVPDDIKACNEFASLCPKSATAMMIRLGEHSG
jgi:amino-acid N-acetyltransferase